MTFSKLALSIGSQNDQLKCDAIKKYLTFWTKNVRFFPLNIPEEIIWNNDELRKRVPDERLANTILREPNIKQRFDLIAKEMCGENEVTGIEISVIHKIFINKWISQKDENYQTLTSLLNEIKTKVE